MIWRQRAKNGNNGKNIFLYLETEGKWVETPLMTRQQERKRERKVSHHERWKCIWKHKMIDSLEEKSLFWCWCWCFHFFQLQLLRVQRKKISWTEMIMIMMVRMKEKVRKKRKRKVLVMVMMMMEEQQEKGENEVEKRSTSEDKTSKEWRRRSRWRYTRMVIKSSPSSSLSLSLSFLSFDSSFSASDTTSRWKTCSVKLCKMKNNVVQSINFFYISTQCVAVDKMMIIMVMMMIMVFMMSFCCFLRYTRCPPSPSSLTLNCYCVNESLKVFKHHMKLRTKGSQEKTRI